MTFMRRPRVFLSYRHEERNESERHRAWVNEFAHSLASWNVDVVWDGRLRSLFRPHSPVDPNELPFLAEVSTLCLQAAQVFMPILTSGYLERVGVGDGRGAHGTVTEEWRRALAERAAGHAEIVAIVREWPVPGWESPPTHIAPENAWDFRFVAPERDEVELLGDALQGLWTVERPRFDEPFVDLISGYLKFCTFAFKLPWPGIERWGCDFNRPPIYMQHRAHLTAMNPVAPDAGRQRDLREATSQLGIREMSPKELANLPPTTPGGDASAEERAMQIMRTVMTAHVGKHRRPFDFSSIAPGGRVSRGLYFGETVSGFSYLYTNASRADRDAN